MLLLLAQGSDQATSSTSGLLGTLVPLLLIGVFVYLFMIRPQRKRQRATQEMQEELSIGDDVVTVGGLHARVDAIGESTVDLEVTEDIILRFKRSSVGEIIRDEPEPDATDDESDDDLASGQETTE